MKASASKENITSRLSSKPFFLKDGKGSSFAPIRKLEQPFFAPNISRQVESDHPIQKDDQVETERVKQLNEDYNNAITTNAWQKAAELLNAFNRQDIVSRLYRLNREQIGAIHQGALDNPKVGPNAQVAQVTAANLQATDLTLPGLQRVKAAIDIENLQALIKIQQELRQQMVTDPKNPPSDARVGLATARHWIMDQIAAIRDRHQPQLEKARSGRATGVDATSTVETLENSMDAECTPYLEVLMQGDPQFRFEHFSTDISDKVFAAVRLHSVRRGVGQIGHRVEAEAEARRQGKLSTGSWCGAFAYTQAEQGGGFDPYWRRYMLGESGIRSSLVYSNEMAKTWIWIFDHWETLKEYHEHRKSLRWYQPIQNSPPPNGIQAGDLVLIDNAFGTDPDHISTAISFDGRFITTIGGNQGAGEAGVSRSSHAFDIQNNPSPNDVTNKDSNGKPIKDLNGNRTSITGKTKNVRIHGIGRWSIVDYEKHLYKISQEKPAPPSTKELTALG